LLEARVRAGKVPQELPCDLGDLSREYHRRGGLLVKLGFKEANALKAMAAGVLDGTVKVPAAAQKCARQSLNILSAPPTDDPDPFPVLKVPSGRGPFCP